MKRVPLGAAAERMERRAVIKLDLDLTYRDGGRVKVQWSDAQELVRSNGQVGHFMRAFAYTDTPSSRHRPTAADAHGCGDRYHPQHASVRKVERAHGALTVQTAPARHEIVQGITATVEERITRGLHVTTTFDYGSGEVDRLLNRDEQTVGAFIASIRNGGGGP